MLFNLYGVVVFENRISQNVSEHHVKQIQRALLLMKLLIGCSASLKHFIVVAACIVKMGDFISDSWNLWLCFTLIPEGKSSLISGDVVV